MTFEDTHCSICCGPILLSLFGQLERRSSAEKHADSRLTYCPWVMCLGATLQRQDTKYATYFLPATGGYLLLTGRLHPRIRLISTPLQLDARSPTYLAILEDLEDLEDLAILQISRCSISATHSTSLDEVRTSGFAHVILECNSSSV